jgi:hypothetical protein
LPSNQVLVEKPPCRENRKSKSRQDAIHTIFAVSLGNRFMAVEEKASDKPAQAEINRTVYSLRTTPSHQRISR